MKVSELQGERLAYWVARAQGWEPEVLTKSNTKIWLLGNGLQWSVLFKDYRPDQNWEQCGELIEKYKPKLYVGNVFTRCRIDDANTVAPDPKIAICRCVAASVYGEEVEESNNEY